MEPTEELAIEVEKTNNFQNDVIFLDGLWGTGKSLLGPIISGMDRVEKAKQDHVHEFVCVLRHLNKISPDAASWMFRTYVDFSQYNNVIGREINLRWSDDTGFANNPSSFRYLARLFRGEGDSKVDQINRENLALNIGSHMIMLVAGPLFETFGPRLRLLEVVRHPLYMVTHWYNYLGRFDSPREFTVSFNYQGTKVPWFAAGWADEFVESSLMDRTLLSIARCSEWLDEAIREASAQARNVLVLSFEALLMDTDRSMDEVASFLGRSHHRRLRSILRRQKIPRPTISQGRGHAAYGWRKGNAQPEEAVYAQAMDFARSEASSEVMARFMQTIESYDERYPSLLSQYR
jgi:hypothetical protein